MTSSTATAPTSFVQFNAPFEAYAVVGAVNWSTLKEMRRSPLHYAHRHSTPLADRKTLMLGRAAHVAILEPQRFASQYVVFTGRRAGKAWDAFKAAANANGKCVLSPDEHTQCIGMRDSVRRHAVAGPLLAKGMCEVSIVWVDPATGLRCKARLDWLADVAVSGWILTDLKTAADLDMRRFGSTAARLGYHAQVAWYRRACKATDVELVGAPRILAVENTAPFDVGVFPLDEDLIYAGDEECTQLLERVAECFKSGQWPGRYADETPLEMPKWWFAQDGEAELAGITFNANGDD